MKTGKVNIELAGSLQNPSWSRDGREIAFTLFHKNYNLGDATVHIYDFNTETTHMLAWVGGTNVSQPGSTWNKNGQIIFSSDRDGHYEIWVNSRNHLCSQLTRRFDRAAYEPSWGPDGESFVFESHRLDVENNGIIMMCRPHLGY